MATAHHTLQQMNQTLQQCLQGQLPTAALTRQWRADGALLPLPERFAQVLGDLLDRLEAGALFSEESCSFSQKDLLDSLQLWADKARAQLDKA
jgi:non-ribosomal peptide synthetase component F